MRQAINERDQIDYDSVAWERNEKRQFYNDVRNHMNLKQYVNKSKINDDRSAEKELVQNDIRAH